MTINKDFSSSSLVNPRQIDQDPGQLASNVASQDRKSLDHLESIPTRLNDSNHPVNTEFNIPINYDNNSLKNNNNNDEKKQVSNRKIIFYEYFGSKKKKKFYRVKLFFDYSACIILQKSKDHCQLEGELIMRVGIVMKIFAILVRIKHMIVKN